MQRDENGDGKKSIKVELEKMKKYANLIRLLAHIQVKRMKGLKQKKAHLMEIQVNGAWESAFQNIKIKLLSMF